jgi:hypothetical protein
MAEDWFIASIDRVEGAANDLHEALDRLMDPLREARSERMRGVGGVDIVEGLLARGGRDTRLASTVAFREFERAVTDYRASKVRALVEEGHLTFTKVAEVTGVSRQMVARLYREAVAADSGGEGRDEN